MEKWKLIEIYSSRGAFTLLELGSVLLLGYTVKIITPYGVKRGSLCKKSKILLEMEWKLTTSSKS